MSAAAPAVSPVSDRLQRWLFGSLLLWGVGAELTEGLVTVGMAFTLIGVVIALWPRRSLRGVLQRLREWWPLTAFLAWALVVPLLAGRRPEGTGVARMGDWLALPAGAVAFSALTAQRRRWLAWSIGGVFVLSCLCAGLQFRGWWPRPELFAHWHWTGIPFDRVYEVDPRMPGRFPGGGLLFHRLKFADIGGLIVVGAVAWGWRQRGPTRWAAWAAAALGIVSIMVFAWARAAGVAAVGALVVMVIVSRLNLTRMLAVLSLVALVVGGSLAVSPRVRERFTLVFDSGSNGGRDQLWAAGLRAVKSAPLAGIGLWQFRPGKFADDKMPEFMLHHPGKAHDQYLSFAAEIGIPGAVLFIVLLCWLALRMRGPEAMAGYGLLFFFATLSLVHDPLFHASFSMALMLSLAIALVTAEEGRLIGQAPTSSSDQRVAA